MSSLITMEKKPRDSITPAVVDKICRTCLWQSKEMKSLFSVEDNRFLSDILLFVANIEVKQDDKLPQQICAECEIIIHKADAFKRRCLESEAALHEVLKVPKTCSVDDKTLVKQDLESKENLRIVKIDQKNTPSSCSEQTNDFKVKPADIDCKSVVKIEYSEESEITEFGEDFIDAYNDEPSDCKSESISVDDIFAKFFHKDYKPNKRCRNNTNTNSVYPKCLTCNICNLEFLNVKDYKSHKATHKPLLKKESEPPKFQCHLCMRKFKKKSSLIIHIEKHEENAHIKYTCELCKREFQRQISLDKHISSVHTKRRGYSCSICFKSFPTEKILQIHENIHASNKKATHSCEICTKSFYMVSTLKDHMRTHTGEKPYLCSICGKGFSQKNNLAQHVRRHQGDKPFKCNECDRSFVSKGELQAHKRKHTGAHPFVCDDCGNGFTTSSSLVKHRRTHTGERPYACDMCPMKFAASGTLKNHRRTHTGEKPYQCSYCERAFGQRNDLVSHIRCHTGERPFVCTICGQSFRKASALKSHSNLHCKESALVRESTLNVLQGAANVMMNQ